MFNTIQQKILLLRAKLLFNYGVLNRKIEFFEDDIYKRLDHFYYSSIPLSMHIKYLRPNCIPHKCYDRSLLLSFAFENPTLIIANMKDLELRYGKAGAWHCFIESGGYIYDPVSLLKVEKGLYFRIRKVKIIDIIYKEDLESLPFIQNIRKTTLEDLRTSLQNRFELFATIPIIQEIADMSYDNEFKEALSNYLIKVQYDYNSILNELNKATLV